MTVPGRHDGTPREPRELALRCFVVLLTDKMRKECGLHPSRVFGLRGVSCARGATRLTPRVVTARTWVGAVGRDAPPAASPGPPTSHMQRALPMWLVGGARLEILN